MKKAFSTLILIFGVFPILVFACKKTDPDCCTPTAWHEGNRIELKMNDEQSQNRARWLMKLYSENDIIIEKAEQYQGKSIKGTLGIIGGRMMIAKGLDLQSGYEIDAADGPALMIQLLLRLLSEAAPEGPSIISTPTDIKHKEAEKSIKVATASASAVFAAPWVITGTLAPDQDSDITFNLKFTSKIDENDYTLMLLGTWTKDNTLGILSGDKEITDWHVFKIGPFTKKYRDATIYDYGAQPISETFNDISELRNHISEQEISNMAN